MKKIITVVMMIATIAAFAQMEITRNRVMGALGLGYTMTTVQDMAGDDVSFTVMGLQIPDVNYEFEAKPNDMFKIYLYGNVGYMMAKASIDGEAEDNFSNELGIHLKPMVKMYLPNDLFVKLVLPFSYTSSTDSGDDAEAMAYMGLDMEAQFGFDNREIYIHGLTPWDRFEKGIQAYAFINMGIMESQDMMVVDLTTTPPTTSIESVDTEDFPMFFGVAGCYAHQMEGNMMLKPYLSFMTQLNEDAEDKDTELVIGAMFAKDFTEQFNLEADLNLNILDTETSTYDAAANEFLDRLMELNISAIGNFYVMPELNIFAGLGMNMDLSREEGLTTTGFELGAIYTMDLLK